MIFIHKETGEIYEIMVKSFGILYVVTTDGNACELRDVVLHGDTPPVGVTYENMHEELEFMGWV